MAIQEEITDTIRTLVKSEVVTSCKSLDTDIKHLQTRVSTLENDKTELVSQVDDLTNRVAKLELERDAANSTADAIVFAFPGYA